MADISYELLHKYNVQGPRYTSYPPAPSWKADIGPTEYESTLQQSNAGKSPAPLSLYFHLPFCEKLCYFCGCTTVITGKNRSFVDPYLASVRKEVEWLSKQVDRKRRVVQLHLGGGTPTYQTPDELKKLMESVTNGFSFDPTIEMGVEIDPRVTTKEHLKTLRELGFNRVSMGVQDFNPQVQEAINRIQTYDDTCALVEEARALGYVSVNMDLIYGLPYQTVDSFHHTIDQILKIGPDRLAVYSYAHVPWLKKHQEHFVPYLPDERLKFEIFRTALKRFGDAGFEYIGMDHFARPNDELALARKNRTLWRNFQGYTTKAGTDLLGIGMSAIGKVGECFFQNEKDLKTYQNKISDRGCASIRGFQLSKNDQMRARVIQNLLCHADVIKTEIEKEFQISFDATFQNSLNQLKEAEKDGLVQLLSDRIHPTDTGRVFLRNLAMPFDAYLPKDGEKKIFSRTV